MDILDLLLRTFITFAVLFTLMRMLGRQEVSQMTFFNFVSAIAIGSIAANLVVDQDTSIINGMIALVGWSAFSLAVEYINIKFKKSRRLLEGEPIIVIKDGKIMEKSLRATKLDIDNLLSMLRQKNVFSVKDVDYAIFETSGKISVMKKEEEQLLTKGDMNIPQKIMKVYPIPTEVISDGVVNTKNLSRLNLNRAWLTSQLYQAGVTSISDVFYAEVQQDGTLYIDKKQDAMKN
ncbi:DUF421 domain-containing protein [Evansella cellulosilytica]|uniref:DUF421 domain-containing protein n=1 Tax=Evansella cellulosilytica (strain ATCC 21833 / DSM 2522 / FERM P-1141 / JCM 9156 / N-4) TaxID=649639 RepID=E6TSM6_EVAC2|nr:DUF421 domain-containing protein [Evansella cellulosilytica]ADU29534.1 protein of unknown function DUF421 [Evansella cellulosilytica DSM 2522]